MSSDQQLLLWILGGQIGPFPLQVELASKIRAWSASYGARAGNFLGSRFSNKWAAVALRSQQRQIADCTNGEDLGAEI